MKDASRKMLRIKMNGYWYAFRPTSIQRMLANNELTPAMYQALTAKTEGVEITPHEIAQAMAGDRRDFTSLTLSDASQVVTLQVDGQAVTTRKIVTIDPGDDDTVDWADAFTDGERGALMEAISEYNNAEPSDFQVVAPFCDIPHADDHRTDDADNASGAAE